MESSSKPRILLFVSPGMGHLIPLVELSKRLVSLNTLHVTLFIISTHTSSSQAQLLKSSSEFHPDLQLIDLTPAKALDIVPTNSSLVARLSMIMQESLAALRSHITSMQSPVALIVDIFSADVFDITDELGIPKYMFVTSSAWVAVLMMYTPTLDADIEGEYVDTEELIQIPGCKPLRPSDVVDPMLDRKGPGYKVYLDICTKMLGTDGILVNTWEDLEHLSLTALKENSILRPKFIMKPRIYPIGPVVRRPAPDIMENGCLEWLKEQPIQSVLYVSFGSGGTLSAEQITELAWGLELSEQRFIWLIRPPVSSDPAGSFFTSDTQSREPSENYLPQGFLTRTFGRGVVVTGWVPQEYILAHSSTSAFLSHCGWNSVIESLINGVPIIAWPLYAEQNMNAEMLVDLGVAVRPEWLPTKGVLKREEIERLVKLVMVSAKGKSFRERVKEIQKGAVKATSKDGSSYASLLQLVSGWGG